MKVNFNNLRKKACYAYDSLARKLNESIDKDSDSYEDIQISSEDIQEEMDELRYLIMSIAMVYEEGNEDFKDILEDVEDITWFNQEDEDGDS